MKSLLIGLIIFALTVMTKQSDYISIEHIGINDKPIYTIIISMEPIQKPWCFNYLVNIKVYNDLKNIIEKYKSNKRFNKNELDGFKYNIYENDTIIINYNLSRKKSIPLFAKMIKTLKIEDNNKELVFELETVIKRISF